jgi:hypothetical protein
MKRLAEQMKDAVLALFFFNPYLSSNTFLFINLNENRAFFIHS